MKRRVFALWLLCYMFLLWPMVKKSYNDSHSWPFQRSIIVQIAATSIDAIAYTNIYGVVQVFKECERIYKDTSLYLNHRDYWHIRHRNEDTQPPDWQILLENDILPFVSTIVILLNLFLSAKRCKNAGVSWWRCFIPLYNPFVLLIKKAND